MSLNTSQQYVIQSITDRLDELFPTTDLLHFYQTAVEELGIAVGADHAFVGAVRDQDPLSVETLVYCKGRKRQPNFSYELEHTPCEQVLNEGICIYPDHVADTFPKDELLQEMMISGYVGQSLTDGRQITGIIAALFMTPIRDPDFVDEAFCAVAQCINHARTAHTGLPRD